MNNPPSHEHNFVPQSVREARKVYEHGVKPQTDFERFALDHKAHRHCQGCGGCLLDPSHLVQSYPSWCVGCRDRIKKNIPAGAALPWAGGWEFRT